MAWDETLEAATLSLDQAHDEEIAAKDAEIAALKAQIGTPELPTISVADITVQENQGPAVFTITLSHPFPKNIAVAYATANGTATGGVDFTSTANTVTFVAGETVKTVSVSLINDTAVENPETFYLKLSNIRVGLDYDPQAIATIVSEDTVVTPPTTPPTTGFPDATNTGVTPGTVLAPSGSVSVSTAGAIVENRSITGDVFVNAANVTIRNCKIVSSGFAAINFGNSGSGLKIENCELNGQGKTAGSYAVMLPDKGILSGCNIFGWENGVSVQGPTGTVKRNYIHDLQAAGGDPHYDGISIQGGQNGVLVEDNSIFGRDTADVFIKNDFGPINNVKVNHNYLAGKPNYLAYSDGRASGGPITNVSITNNVCPASGVYGYWSIDNNTVVVSGNVDATGKPVG